MVEFSEVRYARSTGDIDIAYQTAGRGPIDLVFVCGFTSHLDMVWDLPFFNWILALDGVARIIMFDKRGTGLSDRSLGFGSLAERTDDIRAVMDACGVQRAALWGISEGGPMCVLFAATYPERISHLILYGSGARFTSAPDYPYGMAVEDLAPMLDALAPNWGKGELLDMFIADPPAGADAKNARARFERSACTPQMMRDILQKNIEIDVRSLLPTISVPTLVMHNTGDPLLVVDHGRYLGEHIPDATYIERQGNFHGTWETQKLAWVLDEVREFIGGTAPQPPPVDRVLATVLFTDIVGSTERTASVGDRSWRDLLDKHDELARAEIGRCNGRLVKTTGDGILATFDGPARAIDCAREIATGSRGLGLGLRAGMHTGEIERRGQDIAGLGVVIARRICDMAADGELLASRTVKDLATGSGITFADRGSHVLKGVPDDWQLYAVD
jgi:class 3 adenylate cyclase/pimeloyl-ACP methyl ester carboxylesterase